MTRTPKQNPKYGDIVAKNGSQRIITSIETNENGTATHVHYKDGNGNPARTTISAWRSWCRTDCQVLYTNEQEGASNNE